MECKTNLECREDSVTIGTFVITKGLFGDTRRKFLNACPSRALTTQSALDVGSRSAISSVQPTVSKNQTLHPHAFEALSLGQNQPTQRSEMVSRIGFFGPAAGDVYGMFHAKANHPIGLACGVFSLEEERVASN